MDSALPRMLISWHRSLRRALAVLLLCACACQLHAQAQPAAPAAPVYGYRVVNTYPHDPHAFTQGLIWLNGYLYESTGLYGRSSLRKLRLEDGRVLERRAVDNAYFAEGLTDWGPNLVQLTWISQLGFVYDRATFRLNNTFAYQGPGWGLTHDGARLMLSNGTSTITFLDPESFADIGHIDVRYDKKPVINLNELEYIDGEIFANVWHTDLIVRISPQTGNVTGLIDLSGLLSDADRAGRDIDVLNGIAWDPTNRRMFVTGKLWPKLFEIELVQRCQPEQLHRAVDLLDIRP